MVVIIGATSFIGVYTVHAFLKQGIDVVVTGRNDKFKEYYDTLGVKYINLDLTSDGDFSKLPKDNVDAVILLAALLPANSRVDLSKDENAEDYFKINTIGTIKALEYCRVNRINKLISTTSYADVFNSWKKDYRITEEEPRGFSYKGDHTAYIISKNAATDIIEYYNQQHGMENAVFRLPPVYGVGPHGSLFVSGNYQKSGIQIFIEKATIGEEICIYGDKNVSRDIVYVKDVADAFVKAVKSNSAYGMYNIGSGVSTTLDEQAKIIARVFAKRDNVSQVIYRPEIPNNSHSYIFDISKARKDFGYDPKYADFFIMMTDFREELEHGNIATLFKVTE